MTRQVDLHSMAALRAAQASEERGRPPPARDRGMPLGLTRHEARTLRAIQNLQRGPVAPSYREIGAAVGVAHSRVAAIIAQLESKGWLARSPYRARSLRLLATLPPVGLVEAIEVAVEHQQWCWTQGIGLWVMLDMCGIEAADTLTEGEAAGLLAEHWAGIRKRKEVGGP